MSKHIQIKERFPLHKKDTKSWKLSRKKFIGTLLIGGLTSQLSSAAVFGSVNSDQELLSTEQFKILQSVQQILFPSTDAGPGASDINSTGYLLWVLSDPNKDPDEVQYIINGIGWVDETAEENYNRKYVDLNQLEKEQLIADISIISWGESWLSVILTFIFEALLSDPQYGGNPDQLGWKWLSHNPGQPRPTTELLYPEIITTIRN